MLLFIVPHQVGFFLEYLDLYLMKIVQMKRRLRGNSSSFWWCRRYSAIWSDFREHSVSSKFMDIVPVAQIDSKLFFECSRELEQIAELRLH